MSRFRRGVRKIELKTAPNSGRFSLERGIPYDDDSGAPRTCGSVRTGTAASVSGIGGSGDADFSGIPVGSASAFAAMGVRHAGSGNIERQSRAARGSPVRPSIVHSRTSGSTASGGAVVALVERTDVSSAEAFPGGSVSVAAADGVSASSTTARLSRGVQPHSASAASTQPALRTQSVQSPARKPGTRSTGSSPRGGAPVVPEDAP